MPLDGYLRDLDVDGSLYNTRPARVVVVVLYSSNKSTKTQANEKFHYTILVN